MRCVSSPACLPGPMYSALDDAALPAPGFPIRRSTVQWPFSASPWLIAAVHVLLRLLVPRHPPCALTILTVSQARAVRIRSSSVFLPFRMPPGSSKGDIHEHPPERRVLGLVQFSRSTEATNGGLPPASLRTEQRYEVRKAPRLEPGRRFRKAGDRRTWPALLPRIAHRMTGVRVSSLERR